MYLFFSATSDCLTVTTTLTRPNSKYSTVMAGTSPTPSYHVLATHSHRQETAQWRRPKVVSREGGAKRQERTNSARTQGKDLKCVSALLISFVPTVPANVQAVPVPLFKARASSNARQCDTHTTRHGRRERPIHCPADLGFLGALSLQPSTFATGSYGWKGSKRLLSSLLTLMARRKRGFK